jgi:PAS domain S-box-containing protein
MPNSFTPRILVVNDALDALKFMEIALTSAGFFVLTAMNGREALQISAREEIDAVVSDVVMPVMGGVELCQKLKENPSTAKIPFILASAARIEEHDSLSGLNAGADDYLVLPLRPSELLIKLTRLIERARMEETLRETEKRHQTVVQNASVIFFAFDLNGKIIFSEGAGLKKLSLRTAETVGQSAFELYKDYPTAVKAMRRALTGETFTTVVEIGDLFFDVSYSPMFDSDHQLCGALGVATDITERMQAERKAEAVIEQLAAAVEREALINRISNTIRESLNAENVFRAVVNELGANLQVDRSHLYFFDEANGVVRSAAQFAAPGVPLISDEEIPYSLAHNILPAFREKGFVAIEDAANTPAIRELYENILRPRGVRSIMFVAVRVRNEILGLLSLVTISYNKKWSESDIALAGAVADQAGIAIRQAELYRQAQTTLQRERLINRLSTEIRSSLKLSDVLRTATHELGRALEASHVYLRFYTPHQAKIAPEYLYKAFGVTAPDPITVGGAHPIGQFMLQQRQTVVINDVLRVTDEYASIRDYAGTNLVKREIRSAVYCPICVDNVFRGAICIEQTDRLRRWTESEVALIEAVSAQLSLGVAHAELFELTRRAKREWEVTFDAMSDGVFIFDKDGFLIRVNQAGAAMEQSTPVRMMGAKCCQILCEEEGLNDCIVEEIVKSRKSITVEFVSKTLKRPLLITTEPIINAEDTLVGVVCTVRDLYELRKAEAVARERQTLLIRVLEGILEPIFAVDSSGKVLWGNKATRDSYGITGIELKNRIFVEMLHPEDRSAALNAFDASLAKLPQCFESRYLTAEGETRHAIFNSVPLQIEDRINGVLWFVRDITQQKIAVEQAVQADKLRALGQLASGVAHDFNNVLAAIQGRVSLLERQEIDENLRHNLTIIKTAAQDAAATVRRIQSFARQSAEPDFSAVEVGSLLRDTVELLRPRWMEQAHERGIEYSVTSNISGAFPVSGNASELREVFINLLINAFDAMPQGGELKIDCKLADEVIEIKFADSGEGIPSNLRERIFEPFFSTKGMNGMGLGLSVSYGIIKQHGGEISVESKVGSGSTFKVTLPKQAVEREGVEMVEISETKQNLSILVVDDEEFVREALIEMVSELATEVVGAEDVNEALNKLQSRHFDVVFTDLSMPEMDGWELAREIHQKWQTTKTVLVTGYGKGLAMTPEKRELVHAVIGKPFNFTQLSQTLGKISAHEKNH